MPPVPKGEAPAVVACSPCALNACSLYRHLHGGGQAGCGCQRGLHPSRGQGATQRRATALVLALVERRLTPHARRARCICARSSSAPAPSWAWRPPLSTRSSSTPHLWRPTSRCVHGCDCAAGRRAGVRRMLPSCSPLAVQGGQLTPIDLIVETEYHRAAPGGTGGTKCVGNYSPVLKTQLAAKAVGFSDVVYLDAKENKFIEEVSSCNIFVVKGKRISTPALRRVHRPAQRVRRWRAGLTANAPAVAPFCRASRARASSSSPSSAAMRCRSAPSRWRRWWTLTSCSARCADAPDVCASAQALTPGARIAGHRGRGGACGQRDVQGAEDRVPGSCAPF